jgi:hypothetical protein
MIHGATSFPSKQVEMVMKGVRRIKGDCTNRKLPITTDILLSMRARIDMSSSWGSTFWAACLIAFYGMLRKSSLFPPKTHEPPTVGDVQLFKWGMVISFGYSKTVQCKQRKHCVVLPMCKHLDIPLCPVRALINAWRRAGVCSRTDPLLPALTQGCIMVMSASSFSSILGALLLSMNLKGYSGHSFRRGGASHALARGVPAEVIMAQGDWRSLAYLDYLDVDTAGGRAHHLIKMME